MSATWVPLLIALAGLIGGVATKLIEKYRGSEERKATETNLAVSAAAAVQDVYGDLISDLQAQVVAARTEAKSSRDAARESQRAAEEAEENAWRAEGWAREMQRFLAEVRPLIETYVPDSAAWLSRLDRLAAGGKSAGVNPAKEGQ